MSPCTIATRLRPSLLFVLAIPVVSGFASVPLNSPHADITTTAAEWSGWPEGGVDALVVAAHNPDYEQIDWKPRGDDLAGYGLAPEYDAASHCDRVPPTDNATAFARTRTLLDDQRRIAVEHPDAERVVEAVGAALHALQDCFSHSDYVDLARDDQQRFVEYLLANGSAPQVRLVASDPAIDEPGRPPDPYPHDLYAKDSPNFNNESKALIGDKTKFELAKRAATHTSARFLNETLAELTPEIRDALGDLAPSAPDRWPIPGIAVWSVIAATVLIAARRRA